MGWGGVGWGGVELTSSLGADLWAEVFPGGPDRWVNVCREICCRDTGKSFTVPWVGVRFRFFSDVFQKFFSPPWSFCAPPSTLGTPVMIDSYNGGLLAHVINNGGGFLFPKKHCCSEKRTPGKSRDRASRDFARGSSRSNDGDLSSVLSVGALL